MSEQAPDERFERHSSTPPEIYAPRGRGLGVLVIESDPDLQWHLARMLTVRGHRVVGTSSGDGAHALLERWPADLVVVGEDLPGMDGFEVCRRIREQLETVEILLVASGHSADAKIAARLAGAAVCIERPLAPGALAKALHPLEARARERQAAAVAGEAGD
ncbi:MAG: response regulator [Deltaproteobacteria bacterium]|nr:response regulator [Deltaproteobacteria bacterium]